MDTVQPDRERFDQSRVGVRHFVGQCECVPGRYDGKFGEAAAVGSHPDVASLCAVRHEARCAVLTAAARNDRHDSYIGAFAPPVGIRTDRDDLASEFVAHDHAGRHEGLRLDVRPTDATGHDTDDQLVGSWCRIGYFDDVEPVLFRCDCCPHCLDPFEFDVEHRQVFGEDGFEVGPGYARPVQ